MTSPSSLSCAVILRALHAYIDGEIDMLDSVTPADIGSHTAACADCATYLARLRILKEKVRCSCGCEAPAELHSRVMTRLTQLYSDGTSTTYSDEIHIQRG